MVASGLCGKGIRAFWGSAGYRTKLFAGNVICTTSKAVLTRPFARRVLFSVNSKYLHPNDGLFVKSISTTNR